jgi:DnaK suppressor protein
LSLEVSAVFELRIINIINVQPIKPKQNLMTNEDKKILRTSILKQIEEFEAEVKLLDEAAKPVEPDCAYGRVSRMDAINNKVIVEAALKDKQTSIDRFRYALTKIETVEYGKCSRCGMDIAVKRLMSIPYANLCIECANKFR